MTTKEEVEEDEQEKEKKETPPVVIPYVTCLSEDVRCVLEVRHQKPGETLVMMNEGQIATNPHVRVMFTVYLVAEGWCPFGRQ